MMMIYTAHTNPAQLCFLEPCKLLGSHQSSKKAGLETQDKVYYRHFTYSKKVRHHHNNSKVNNTCNNQFTKDSL